MDPELIGYGADGRSGIFRLPDGSTIEAALDEAPYARELAARSRVAPPAPAAPGPTPLAVAPAPAPVAPAAPTPPRVGVPPMLARAPEVPRTLARPAPIHRPTPAEEEIPTQYVEPLNPDADWRGLSAEDLRIAGVPEDLSVDPDTGHLTRRRLAEVPVVGTGPGYEEWQHPGGGVERVPVGPHGTAPSLATTPTHAGTLTRPDGTTVTTDASGAVVAPLPADIPPAWLAPGTPEAMTARLRGSVGPVLAADPSQARTSPAPTLSTGPTPPTPAPSTVVDGRAPGPAPRPGAGRGGGGARLGGPSGAPTAPAPLSLPEQMLAAPDQSPGVIADLAAGAGQARRAPDLIDRQQFIETQRAGLAAQDARRQQAIEQQAERERQALEQERQGAMRGALDAYRLATQRVADAHIDPGSWFRDQGAFGTIGATIAVALGALGQAIGGTSSNGALDVINQAIDRDLQAQQSEIDAGRAAADMTANMVGLMQGEFTDRAAAQSAARAAMLQQAALHLQEQSADLQGEEARVNADALRQQLEAQAAQAQQEALDQELQRRLTAAQIARTQAQAAHEMRGAGLLGGGGAGRPFRATTAMYDVFDRAIAGGATVEEAAQRAGFPPGTEPRHSPMTTEVRGVVDALSSSLDALEAASHAEDIAGVGLWDSHVPGPEGRLVRDEIANAIDLLGRLRSGGAISESEEGRFTAILGASGSQTEDQFRAGLARVRRELNARLSRGAEGSEATDRDVEAFGGSWVE